MKTNFFHKIALLPVFIALLMGCDRSSTGITSEPPKPQNCQQAYKQLSTKEFHSLQEAKTATRDFLSKYKGDEKCSVCYDIAEQIESEFVIMDNLLLNIDNSSPKQRYCDFMSMVNTNKKTFSSSSFETVRKTWNYLVAEKKDTYRKERLDLIDEKEFKPYLMQMAKDRALEWYGGRLLVVVDEDCYILNDELVELYGVEGKAAKRGVCTVHVAMQGYFKDKKNGNKRKLDVGRIGAVEIRVEGTLKLSDSNCNISFAEGSAEKTKAIGECERIDKKLEKKTRR